MNKIKTYPLVEKGKEYHVRYPVQTSTGKWVAVDVLDKGYRHLVAPVVFDTEKLCQKSCDTHNRFHGWDEDEANVIVGKSMGLFN